MTNILIGESVDYYRFKNDNPHIGRVIRIKDGNISIDVDGIVVEEIPYGEGPSLDDGFWLRRTELNPNNADKALPEKIHMD
jgi:hypothetical protein